MSHQVQLSPAAAHCPAAFLDPLRWTSVQFTGRGDLWHPTGFQPARVVLVSQADHALGSAEPVERVVGQQPGDDLLTRGVDGGGLTAAPGRGAHMERDLLRR